MDLLSTGSQGIIKNTEATCQYVLLRGTKLVAGSHACVRDPCGVRCMEQVRVGRPSVLIGRRAAQQDSADAAAARQSRALSPALRQSASVKLKIKRSLSQLWRFLAFRSVRALEKMTPRLEMEYGTSRC